MNLGEWSVRRGAKKIYKAHALRWAGLKQSSGKSLAKGIDKEKNFIFRPYTFVPTGIHKVRIFEEVNLEVVLMPQSSFPRRPVLLRRCGRHPASLKLKSEKGTKIYNPQLMMRQFSYD